MDQFAQSRGDDDLFDDEIVPIQKSGPAKSKSTTQADPAPAQNAVETATPEADEHKKSDTTVRGQNRGRGRGRGGVPRNSTKSGLGDSKYAPKSNRPEEKTQKDANNMIEPNSSSVEPKDTSAPASDTAPEDATTVSIPTGPANPALPRPPAVKGNRLNTGGVQRPRLTEDELNAKLAAAKERNQNRAAAYAREQADAENFAERERAASVKRAQETAERRALEGERERNRERKLRGQGGREWDAKKNESDYSGRGRGDRRRYFNPGDEDRNDDLSMYEWHEDRGRGRGRGRGGRGGRGRGRGDAASHRGTAPQTQPSIKESDFPALPGSTEKVQAAKAKTVSQLENMDANPGGSWAEQVEARDAGQMQ